MRDPGNDVSPPACVMDRCHYSKVCALIVIPMGFCRLYPGCKTKVG